jgi:anti-sigma factor RsiW
MSHDDLQAQVLELAIGALDPKQARVLEAHLATCATCAAELASLRAARASVAALPMIPAPERGQAVLLAAARQAAEARGAARPTLLPRWAWGAAFGLVGATAVVVVTLRLSSTPPASVFDQDREALAGPTLVPAPAANAPPAAPPTAAAETKASAKGLLRRDEVEPRVRPIATAASTPTAPPAEADSSSVEDRAPEVIGIGGGAPAVTPAVRSERRVAAAVQEELRPEPPAAPAPPAATDRAKAEPSGPRRLAAKAALGGAAEAYAPSAAPAPTVAAALAMLRPELRSQPGCGAETRRVLWRDQAGRLVRREREGTLDGVGYQVEERFDEAGRLAAGRVTSGGTTSLLSPSAIAAGRLETGLSGLSLAPSAAAAEAEPPRCPPRPP